MIYALSDWQFWGFGLWFLIAVAISWYVPGSLLIRRFKVSAVIHVLLSVAVGALAWTALAYVLGYLGARWLMIGYLAGSLVLSYKHWQLEQQRWQHLKTQLRTQPWWLYLVVGLGSLNQLIQVAGTGLRYGDQVGFFRVNSVDGMMHLAFMSSMLRSFPAMQPGAEGLLITNYHYWSDLMMAELSRVWHLPLAHVFFQYIPLVLVVLTGLATYALIRVIGGSRLTGFIGLMLLYFGGDLAYVFSLLLHQTWGFHVAAIDNGATQLLNMPHSVSKWLLTTALIPVFYWLKTRRTTWGLLSVLMLAPLAGFKVYFGIFAGLGLATIITWWGIQWLWSHRQQRSLSLLLKRLIQDQGQSWLLLALFTVVAAVIYLPPNKSSGGLFWSPLEWPRLFLSTDHLDFRAWWLRKQVYDEAGSLKGIVVMDLISIAICLLSVYGTRLLGFLPWLPSYKKLTTSFSLFLLIPSLVFVFLGLYTLQVSGLFNVFNFFAVSAIAVTLVAAFTLADWWSRHWLLKIIVIVILVIGLPRVVYHDWVAIQQQAKLEFEKSYSAQELAALEYIRTQTPPNSVIQSHPQNLFDQQTPYVAFFTQRPTFLTGTGMLRSHNQPIESRVAALDELVKFDQEQQWDNRAHELGIDYFYLRKHSSEALPFSLSSTHLEVVFENDQAMVLKVKSANSESQP